MEREHTGLKILGVLAVLGGVLMIFSGLALISIGSVFSGEADESVFLIPILIPIGVAVAIMGAVYSVIGIISMIFGYYIFKERSWAYWLLFVLMFIGLFGSLFMLNMWFILYLIVVLYLYSIKKDFMGDDEIKFVGNN